MTSRVSPQGSFNSGDVVPSAEIDTLAGGKVGKKRLIINSSGTTTVETILFETVTVGADWEVDIDVTVNCRATGPTGAYVAIIRDGEQIQRGNFWIPKTDLDVGKAIFIDDHPDAGDIVYSIAIGISGDPGETVTSVNDGGDGDSGVTLFRCVATGPAF